MQSPPESAAPREGDTPDGKSVPSNEARERARGGTEAAADNAQPPVPVIWLIGKVQSGKSSIVRAITQCSAAEVGNGFKACTRSAHAFDFPADYPILRFLDTRGLGESAYDATEDLAVAERQAHVLLVTMRAMDMAQDAVIEVVRSVLRKHPNWSIVVAQTCLHEGYEPGQGHIVPYPFAADAPDDQAATAIPPDLWRCIHFQRGMFASLPRAARIIFVPIDFTFDTDALPPVDYGLDALADALVSVAPAAIKAALEALPITATHDQDRRTAPVILGHAIAAGGSDLVPIAGAVTVSAIQARLLQRIGHIFSVTWDRRMLAEFAAAVGAGVAVRTVVGMGLRQVAKLIPVYGQTLGAATSAAMSYAITFAMGKAAVYFLSQRQRGLATAGTAAAYQAALREALRRTKNPTSAPTVEPAQP